MGPRVRSGIARQADDGAERLPAGASRLNSGGGSGGPAAAPGGFAGRRARTAYFFTSSCGTKDRQLPSGRCSARTLKSFRRVPSGRSEPGTTTDLSA